MIDFLISFMSWRSVLLSVLFLFMAGLSAFFQFSVWGVSLTIVFGLSFVAAILIGSLKGIAKVVAEGNREIKRQKKQKSDEAQMRRDFIKAGKEK